MILHIRLSKLERDVLFYRFVKRDHLYNVCQRLGLTSLDISNIEREVLKRLALACPVDDHLCIHQIVDYLNDYVFSLEENKNDNENLRDS